MMQSRANSSPSRPETPRAYSVADELWAHLAGMFGADAIERKFGVERPPQWDMALKYLKPFELERGLRRLLASGTKFPPTLPEFMRLAKAVETDEDDRRAPPVPALPAPVGDRWEIARASQVGCHLCANFARYSHPADLPPRLSPAVLSSPDYRPHPVSVELRAPLYEAGRRWADSMRAYQRALGGEVPADMKREAWEGHLREAEAAVDDIRARHELPEPVRTSHSSRHAQPVASHMSSVLEKIATGEAA